MTGIDGFEIAPAHHGRPMVYKGARTWWEGDFAYNLLRYLCDCGFGAEVKTTEMDGGPEAVRRRVHRMPPSSGQVTP